MGWLRERMDATNPRIGSFDELARRCLLHAEWPAGIQPKARSLAALFSKFDRLLELEWLLDREQVQQVLAVLLGCPLADIRQALNQGVRREDARIRRFRLPDAPQARPIDLAEEELPPGLPEVVQKPRSWRRSWWRARVGAGQSLVERWFTARGMVQVLAGYSVAEIVEALEPEGPYLILLSGTDTAGSWPGATNLLVVSSEEPPDASWQLVESPKPAAYLLELLQWLEPRFPPDGRFRATDAATWIQQHAAFVNDFDGVVGVAAMLDRFGARRLPNRSLHDLADRFVQQRFQEALPGDAERPWLEQFGFEALAGLARACLVESDEPLLAARDQEQWIQLVPAEFQRKIDAEWAQLSLARAGVPLSVQDLEKALSNVPPGAFRVVRGLIAAELLAHDDAGKFRIRPHWLAQVLEQRAVRTLLKSSLFEWGEALLRNAASETLRTRCVEQLISNDFAALDSLDEFEDAANPAFVAAVETLFQATALAMLQGHSPDEEQLQDLLEVQLRCAARDAAGVIGPRLGPPHEPDDGAWWLALWVITESVEPQRESLGTLIPWGEAPPRERITNSISAYLDRNPTSQCVLGAFELVGKALEPHTACADALVMVPHRLSRRTSWSLLQRVGTLRHGVFAVHSIQERHANDPAHETAGGWGKTATAWWKCWERCGFPDTSLFEPSQPWSELLWPYLPPETLDSLLSRNPDFPITYQHFSSEHYRIYFRIVRGCPPGAWKQVTDAALPLALAGASESHDPDCLRLAWQRDAERVLAIVARGLTATPEPHIERLVHAAPAEVTGPLALLFASYVEERGVEHPFVGVQQRWLRNRCRNRVGDWRAAYRVLLDIESRFRRVARALGKS